MGKQKLVEYFEEVETIKEYNGYFCSILEAISIVVVGSICGLRNTSQIHQWAESDKATGFLKEKFGIEHIPCYYWLLNLLKLVKPESLNKCLMKWAESMAARKSKQLAKAAGFRQLPAELDLQGCMIAADALNCRKETPGSDRNGNCLYYSGYRLALREGKVEESMLYWCNQNGI